MRAVHAIWLQAAFAAAAPSAPVAVIDRETRQAALADLGAKYVFELLDTNGDGELSRGEASFDLELRRRFHRVDDDSDASIALDEYAAFHQAELERPLRGDRDPR